MHSLVLWKSRVNKKHTELAKGQLSKPVSRTMELELTLQWKFLSATWCTQIVLDFGQSVGLPHPLAPSRWPFFSCKNLQIAHLLLANFVCQESNTIHYMSFLRWIVACYIIETVHRSNYYLCAFQVWVNLSWLLGDKVKSAHYLAKLIVFNSIDLRTMQWWVIL